MDWGAAHDDAQELVRVHLHAVIDATGDPVKLARARLALIECARGNPATIGTADAFMAFLAPVIGRSIDAADTEHETLARSWLHAMVETSLGPEATAVEALRAETPDLVAAVQDEADEAHDAILEHRLRRALHRYLMAILSAQEANDADAVTAALDELDQTVTPKVALDAVDVMRGALLRFVDHIGREAALYGLNRNAERRRIIDLELGPDPSETETEAPASAAGRRRRRRGAGLSGPDGVIDFALARDRLRSATAS